MRAPVEVTKPCSVALALVLVASTFKIRSATLYSASVTATVSAGVTGDTVSVAVWGTPPKAAQIVTAVVAVTELVVMVKLALVAPAGTVTLAGPVTRGGGLVPSDPPARPAGAAALRVTVPVEALPAVTLLGVSVRDDTIGEPPPGGVMISVADWATVPPKNREMVAEVV